MDNPYEAPKFEISRCRKCESVNLTLQITLAIITICIVVVGTAVPLIAFMDMIHGD